MLIIKLWDSNCYLTYEDMNRIENNVKECYELIFGNSDVITIKNNRTYSSVDTVSDMNRIEGIVKKMADTIQSSYAISPKTNWIGNESISYKDINRIEQNINTIYNIYNGQIKEAPYSCDYNYAGLYF